MSEQALRRVEDLDSRQDLFWFTYTPGKGTSLIHLLTGQRGSETSPYPSLCFSGLSESEVSPTGVRGTSVVMGD